MASKWRPLNYNNQVVSVDFIIAFKWCPLSYGD